MPSATNLKELKGLQGRLAYIRQFIANLSGKSLPFSKLIRKGVTFEWNENYEEAFRGLKKYLTQLQILIAPTLGKEFILYTRALDHLMGSLLA